MDRKVGEATIEIVEGDITLQDTEAIVNAANSSLLGGGGVDGAIHRAGGVSIMEECRKIGGCPTGEAVVTTGGNLQADYVIHTVGPVYSGGRSGEADLLAAAYRNSLSAAADKGLKSVSFPSISTGAYGYPIKEASLIALQTVVDFLEKDSSLRLVRFVLFGKSAFDFYKSSLEELV